MNVLATDPSMRGFGWAVVNDDRDSVVECGVIKTRPMKHESAIMENDRRTREIVRVLVRVIQRNSVAEIVSEGPAGAKSNKAATALARVATIITTLSEVCDLPLSWVTVGQVKQVAGSRVASKQDVQKAVQKRWKQAKLPVGKDDRGHVCDALAAYIAAEQLLEDE